MTLEHASKNTRVQKGFTLIEIIIAVAIIALLAILAFTALPNQLRRSRDAQRKKDLATIKIAFEDFYNDQGQYPESDILLNCDSEEFMPYLQKVPCDPLNEQPYIYAPYPSPVDRSGGYRVFAPLESYSDQIISALNCEGGCGLDQSQVPVGSTSPATAYNYGVSQGVPVSYKDPVGGEGNGSIILHRCEGGVLCNSCDPEQHNDCVSAEVCAATCGL